MVTIKELDERIENINERFQNLNRLEREQRKAVSERIPQRRFGAGVTSEQQEAVLQRRQVARENIKQIQEQKTRLKKTEGALQSARRTIFDRQKARRRLGGIIAQRQIDFNQRARAQGLDPIFRRGELVGFRDVQRGQTIPIESVPELAGRSPESLIRFQQAGIITVEPTTREIVLSQSLPFQERFREPITPVPKERRVVTDERGIEQPFGPFAGIITTPQERGPVEQVRFEQAVRKQQLEQLPLEERGALFPIETFTLGLATAITGQILFTKNVATQPIKTATAIPGGLLQTSRFVTGGGLARELRFGDPGFIVGRVTGELLVFKAFQPILVGGPPIARGLIARVEPGFRPVKLIEIPTIPVNIKAVVDVPLEKIQPIGLIPVGKIRLEIPKRDLPATVKGAFGTSKKEQAKFIGQIGVVTSQRGLFKLFKRRAKIKETDTGFGIFATPKDIVLQTRISRLGEIPAPATFKEILTGDISLFGPGQPQIIVFPKEKVGRIGGFETLGKLTSELEVATLFPRGPKEIIKIKKLGVTVIGLRRVPIIEAKFPGPIDLKMGKIDLKLKGISTEPISTPVFRPGTIPFVPTKVTKPTKEIGTIKITTQDIAPSKKLGEIPISVPPLRIPSFPVPKQKLPGPPTPRIPLPPIIRTPARPPTLPPIRPPARPPAKPPIRPPPRIIPRVKIPSGPIQKIKAQPGFRTFVIKAGKKIFLPGIRPKGRALRLGAKETTQTLRATFGIEEAKIKVTQTDIQFKPSQRVFRQFRIRKGKRISLEDIFIQRTKEEKGLPGGRLQFPREVRAIQTIKRIKIK